jgi:transcriptional repressor NrdR
MQCPSCSAPTTVVAISEDGSGTSVSRRRQCFECGLRFTTVVTLSLVVIPRNGVTEPFSRQSVITGVRAAAQRNVRVVDALAQQGGSGRQPGRPLPSHLPEYLKTEPSTSGGWSPFSLASASGRG